MTDATNNKRPRTHELARKLVESGALAPEVPVSEEAVVSDIAQAVLARIQRRTSAPVSRRWRQTAATNELEWETDEPQTELRITAERADDQKSTVIGDFGKVPQATRDASPDDCTARTVRGPNWPLLFARLIGAACSNSQPLESCADLSSTHVDSLRYRCTRSTDSLQPLFYRITSASNKWQRSKHKTLRLRQLSGLHYQAGIFGPLPRWGPSIRTRGQDASSRIVWVRLFAQASNIAMTPDPASENEIERSLKADKLATQMKRAQLSSRFFKSQVMRTLLESLLLDGALGLTTCANAITRARILVEHNQLAEELSPFWLTVLLVTLSQTNGSFSAGELAPIATQRHSEHLVKSVLSVLPASVIANSDQSKLDCFTGAAGDERVRTLRAAIEHWLDYTLMAFSVLREHIEPTQLQTTIVP